MYIQFAVHQQHVVAFFFRPLNVRVRSVGVLRVEQYLVAVLVGLGFFHFGFVFIQCEVLAFQVFQESKSDSPLIEFLIAEHTELNEHLHVVPLLFEVLAVVFVEFCQFVSHLFGDIAANLLHVVIALQVRAAHIQRNVRRVDHTVQQGQILRHNVLHLIGHIHLIAVELYLVAVHIQIVLYLREVQNTRQVERVIHVQVNMEQRLLHLHGV